MFKRIFLFVATNLAVVLTIGIVSRLLGVDQLVTARGISYPNLLILSTLYGFGGAIFSLLISKIVAKFSTGARVIDNPQGADEKWLVSTVSKLAEKAGIGMPQVAVYDAPEPNAFATGAFKNSALVAVSTGLLHSMNKQEVEAVLGHEVSHVANGDMVTMTLIMGVVNSFTFFVRFLVRIALSSRDSEGRSSGIGTIILADIATTILLTLLGTLICNWFSRRREFRADAGSAKINNREAMISALRRLGGEQPATLPSGLRAMGINGGGWALFSSHPPLEARIKALQELS